MVYVPAVVKMVRSNGSTDLTFEVQTASKWRYNGSGNWTLLGFNTYAAGSDAL
jgi:hypothetical protein